MVLTLCLSPQVLRLRLHPLADGINPLSLSPQVLRLRYPVADGINPLSLSSGTTATFTPTC